MAWLGVVPVMALLALSRLAISGISVLGTIENGPGLPFSGRAIE